MKARRLVLLAVCLTTACTSGSIVGSGSRGASGPGGSVAGTAQQHDAYGYGAQPTGVDYQPDVVVVGGGPGAIRHASDNGLVWTIDRSAPRADRLKVGAIMLMTSIAAGRIVAIEDSGDSRSVTIAPVQLTDILRNGTIDLHQALDAGDVKFQPVPGLDVGATTPTEDDLPSSFRSSTFSGGGDLAPPSSLTDTFGFGKWKVKPYFNTNGKFGAKVEHEEKGGLKLTAELAFTTSHLSIDGSTTISGGTTKHSGFKMNGITGFEISFGAGVAGGGSDNGKATMILPGEFKLSIPPSPATAELPLTIAVKYKLSVATALTGKNSTLLGTGKYTLDGPIGFDGSTVLTPKIGVAQSLLDSVRGITLGPSGLVTAINVKQSVGVGTPLFNVGPNAGLTVAIGVTNGSSLGSPLARCRGATLDVDLTYGGSVNLDSSLLGALKNFLPAKTPLEFGLEAKTSVFHRQAVVPDVPLCRG